LNILLARVVAMGVAAPRVGEVPPSSAALVLGTGLENLLVAGPGDWLGTRDDKLGLLAMVFLELEPPTSTSQDAPDITAFVY